MSTRSLLVSALLICAICLAPVPVRADLIGTVPTPPGSTVFPGLVTGTDPGTLLASLVAPFTSSGGFDSGTIVSAVYREVSGTLDFYYQVTNNPTAPNCGTGTKPACDALARETNTLFTGFTTATGFRTDGAILTGGVFVDGTVAPVTADRNSTGNVVGFSFNPPIASEIQPDQTSDVLVISTNATNFKAGNASVIDGGVATVAAFEPAGSTTVPEPASFLMLSGGLLALMGVRRVLSH